MGFFILAGTTGVLFRIGMAGGEILGLSLQNIRHAHSHLMFFGWAGFLPLVIIFQQSQDAGELRGYTWMKNAVISIIILSPVTYVFFLFWGYHPVSVGEAQLPLAAIFSSFVMIAWYVFAAGYWKTNPNQDSEKDQWFRLALLMLGISSLGAWGVGALQVVEADNILLSKAMTHFFLGTFTEGWVVLVIVGILVNVLDLKPNDFLITPEKLRIMIVIGAPLTFSYGITYSLLTPELLWSARAGGLLSSAATLLFVFAAVRKCRDLKSIWFWPVLLLGVKGMVQLVVSLYPEGGWFADHNLRILYLHIILLGSFTLTAFAFLHITFKTKRHTYYLMAVSCMLVLISLVLPTGMFPISMKGPWIFDALILAAVLPVAAALYQWIQIKFKPTQQ